MPKTLNAVRAELSDGVKVIIFPTGNFAFGDIIDEADNIVTPVLVMFASDQRLGDCQIIRFGTRDSREFTRIVSEREVPVVYRETTFILPSSARNVRCSGFKFGGKVVTQVKQFVRSREE